MCLPSLLPLASFLGDFRFDIERGRYLLTIVGMQIVDNNFLCYKIFLPWIRLPLKVYSLFEKIDYISRYIGMHVFN